MMSKILYTAVQCGRFERSGRQQGKGAAGLMLRPVTTSSSSAGAAPTAVHASAAAANFSASGGRATAGAAAGSSSTQAGSSTAQTFRYNSFEFIYRQDIGRIILIGQSPETG